MAHLVHLDRLNRRRISVLWFLTHPIWIDEDTTNTALEITTPTDADGNSLTITVTAVPSGGNLAKSEIKRLASIAES